MIMTPGQELLVEFLGKFVKYGTTVFILVHIFGFEYILVCTGIYCLI
jgi:hypothetical protein